MFQLEPHYPAESDVYMVHNVHDRVSPYASI